MQLAVVDVAATLALTPTPAAAAAVFSSRALEEDQFDEYSIPAGTDIFISVWNLHRR